MKKAEPKWSALIQWFVENIKEGDSVTIEMPVTEANRLRAILSVSGRSSKFRWSVTKRSGTELRIKKVGKW